MRVVFRFKCFSFAFQAQQGLNITLDISFGLMTTEEIKRVISLSDFPQTFQNVTQGNPGYCISEMFEEFLWEHKSKFKL